MSKAPHDMSAAELSAAFDARDLSPVEVAQACLARIAASNSRLNGFCHIDGPATLEMAAASEARWMAGEPLSPLDGVPVAIKDLILTRHWPTRRGSRTVDADLPWLDDAPSVARLREAGAVLIGKTTTPEFGWKGTTDSPLTGITRNPWKLSKTPGGSSGGSAVAVAARFCPLALGTDGGGSIRIPASFTGTYGFKPSFGRVAMWPPPSAGTLASVGPMTRTVRDAALLLNVIALPDARDWHALPYEPENFASDLDGSLSGRRVAYLKRMGAPGKIVPEVEALVDRAAVRFAELGAEVEEVDPPGRDPRDVFRSLWCAAAAKLLSEVPKNKRDLLEPSFRKMAEDGTAITLADYMSAMAGCVSYGSALRRFMEDYDFIITPTTATPAFEAGLLSPRGDDGKAWLDWSPFTYPFNMTQQPAASINCGFTSDGLPVGLQIVGRMFDDAGVLAASAAYEAAVPLHDKAPPGF